MYVVLPLGIPKKQAFSAFGTELCHDTYTPWSEDLETPNKIGFTPHSAYIGGDYALKMYGTGGSSDHKCGSSVTLCDCKRECNFYPAMAGFEKNITLQDTTGGLYLDVCSEEAAMPTPQVTQVPIDSNILQIMKAYPDTVPASFNLPSGKDAVCKDGLGNAQCGDGFYTWENFLKAVYLFNSQTTLSKFMSEVDLEKKARTLCSFFAVASATTFEYTACKVRVASKGTVVGCQPEMKPCSQSSVTYKSFRQTQDQMEKYQCMSGKHVERCTDAWGGNLPGPYCYFSRGAIPLEDVRNYSDLEVYFDNLNVKYQGKPIRICHDPDIICRDPVLCWLVAIGVWKMHMDGHPDLPKQEWMEIKDLTILAEDHVTSEKDSTKPLVQGQGLCQVWNAANFQATATPSDIKTYCTPERNDQYVKTCTGLWECNEGKPRWVANRPGVGSGSSPFASDVAAAAGDTQSVLGQCYAYGVTYKGADQTKCNDCINDKSMYWCNIDQKCHPHGDTTPTNPCRPHAPDSLNCVTSPDNNVGCDSTTCSSGGCNGKVGQGDFNVNMPYSTNAPHLPSTSQECSTCISDPSKYWCLYDKKCYPHGDSTSDNKCTEGAWPPDEVDNSKYCITQNKRSCNFDDCSTPLRKECPYITKTKAAGGNWSAEGCKSAGCIFDADGTPGYGPQCYTRPECPYVTKMKATGGNWTDQGCIDAGCILDRNIGSKDVAQCYSEINKDTVPNPKPSSSQECSKCISDPLKYWCNIDQKCYPHGDQNSPCAHAPTNTCVAANGVGCDSTSCGNSKPT